MGEVEKKKERVEKEGKSQRKKGENRERKRKKSDPQHQERNKEELVSIVEVPSRTKDVGSPHG